jgi:serine/threonine-protein kinase
VNGDESKDGFARTEPEVSALPTPASETDPLVGQLLGERYRIEALLGSGGMGAVYRATHVHMKKAVAVKVLHKEMTFQEEVVKRFEREAVAAARIEHPNVAAATDFGRLEDGAFYLVLEFVEGRSLADLQKQLGRLPTERALRIARQIAMALTAAHASGIVHRDLKPDNVMLVQRDGDPDFVKVLDFGIAKLHGEETADQPALTRVGTVFGTPEYMAPEQAKGEPADARADLYTLGMILYEMLRGKSAFEGDDLIVVLTQQMASPPPPLPDDVDSEVRALVMMLLEKDPARRVQSASQLTARFEEILGLPPASNVGYPASIAGVPAVSGLSARGAGAGNFRRSAQLLAALRPGAEVLLDRARRQLALALGCTGCLVPGGADRSGRGRGFTGAQRF